LIGCNCELVLSELENNISDIGICREIRIAKSKLLSRTILEFVHVQRGTKYEWGNMRFSLLNNLHFEKTL